MRLRAQTFTANKALARQLQREAIEKCLPNRSDLSYFGLPSSSLGDVKEWSDIVSEATAVERGEKGKEWELQHDLQFQAFRSFLFGKVRLLRGDIDQVVLKGRDECRNRVRYPFDIVCLDYSGGLFYRDAKNEFTRLKAIATIIAEQGRKEQNFALLVSCNLDAVDEGEIRATIENIRTELNRYGPSADAVIGDYLAHERPEARLKLYLPFFVNQEAAKNRYNCETYNVAFYLGNLQTRMMMFRFCMRFDSRTQALRFPRERLSQIVNKPLIELADGIRSETNFGLPKLAAMQETTQSSA